MSNRISKHINYQSNQQLIKGIMGLIAPSYQEADAHIAKDIERCNELYVMNSKGGAMLAVFMVGYHPIHEMQCCYLGLSACKEGHKNKGLVKQLYLAFAKDCLQKEREMNQRILCYWTTATPIAYHWFTKHFYDVQPDREGNCSKKAKAILAMIATTQYPRASFKTETPFVLRRAAKQVRYSEAEQQRITVAKNELELGVFDEYNLNEEHGDRFLMMGYVPV